VILEFTTEKWPYHYRKFMYFLMLEDKNNASKQINLSIEELEMFKKLNPLAVVDHDFENIAFSEKINQLGNF